MLGVLVFDTLPGLIIGVVLSILLLLYRASRPHIAVLGRTSGSPDQWVDLQRRPQNQTVPGVVVARVESGLFFANADNVADRLRELTEAHGVRTLALDAATTPAIDTNGRRRAPQPRA